VSASDPYSDDLRTRASARLGAVLRDKWRLDRVLGIGGMASVYAAVHLRNKSRVAIKVLHPELSVHASIRARFLREGYAANTVEHPGTVKVIDDDTTEDGAVFLVMELLEGEALDARCKRLGGTLPVAEVLEFTDPILGVLIAAHGRSIVHRDLKPENLFITNDRAVKVLDFGIAHLRELALASDIATKTGAAMGTPAYMPPEQARGLWDEVDARSDLWAVGATMFRLLSGKMVHRGRTPNEMLIAAATRPAPSLATVVPTMPEPVVRLVDRALAFAKDDRWPDARAMQEAVRLAYHELKSSPVSAAPREEPTPQHAHEVATLVLSRTPSQRTEELPRAELPAMHAGTGPGAPASSMPAFEPPVTTADSSSSGRTAPPVPAPSRLRRWAAPLFAAGALLATALTGLHLLGNPVAQTPRPSSSPVPTTPPAITSDVPLRLTAVPSAPLSLTSSPLPSPTATPVPVPPRASAVPIAAPKFAAPPKPPPSKPRPEDKFE
jgi:serine/threonine-protein kinase